MRVKTGPHAEWLTVREVSILYKVPEFTVRTWIKRGKVGAQKQKRGRVQVNRASVEELLSSTPIVPPGA